MTDKNHNHHEIVGECMERFTRIEGQLKSINEMVSFLYRNWIGNGGIPGIVTRVDRLEQQAKSAREQRREARAVRVAAISAAAAAVSAIVSAIFSLV